MKKIITLLLALGAFAMSFAQYNHQQNNDDRNYRTENKRNDQYANSSHDNRNDGWNDRDRRHFNKGNYSARERDFQIEKINREFDFQIQSIKGDRYLKGREKRAAIRHARMERARQIQLVNERFNYNNRRNH